MIVVVEPQCWGFEHSDLNAALLAAVRGAFPTESILFMAERAHLGLVNKSLDLHGVQSIQYFYIKCPPAGYSDARRIPYEFLLIRSIFKKANALKTKAIIFASATSATLWCIKYFAAQYKDIFSLAVPHSVLETSVKAPSVLKPWVFIFWIRFSLLYWNTSQLKILLYGERNKRELTKIIPKLEKYTEAVDLPYFFNEINGTGWAKSDRLCFGSFGEWHLKKGTPIFFQLARDVSFHCPNSMVEFILVGRISTEQHKKLSSSEVIIPSFDRALSREAFESYASRVDYSVFCFDPTSYSLTMSGSFYDALSFVKPVIALKTPFFKYIFDRFGDIGYLCDTYEIMRDLVIELSGNRSLGRYSVQCSNIIKARTLVDIKSISVKIRDMIENDASP